MIKDAEAGLWEIGEGTTIGCMTYTLSGGVEKSNGPPKFEGQNSRRLHFGRSAFAEYSDALPMLAGAAGI